MLLILRHYDGGDAILIWVALRESLIFIPLFFGFPFGLNGFKDLSYILAIGTMYCG